MRPGGPTEAAISRNLMRVSSSGGGGGNNGYDPNQPRDDIGRWTTVGGGSAPSSSTKPKDNFNMDKFIATLNRRAGSETLHKCATFVRIALEAGGADTSMRLHPGDAKDYDNVLKSNGFTPVEPISEKDYVPQKGDVVIFQPYPGGSKEGHIQVWNGTEWVSDFKQPRKFWPDSKYEAAKRPFQIYRRH